MKVLSHDLSSQADLKALSSKELVAVYNELTGKATKKFASREKGLAQTWAALRIELKAQAATEEPTAAEKPAPEKKAVGSGRRMTFRLAPGTVRDVRDTSKRAAVIKLLERPNGATFAEVQEATGWNERQTYEGIRLVHFSAGHGLWDSVDADGAVRVRIVDSLEEFRKLAGAKS